MRMRLIAGDEWENLAIDQLPVLVYGRDVIVFGQCDDGAADDAGEHPAVRGDAIESGADTDVDDHLLEYWRCADAGWRSTECHNRFECVHCEQCKE